jgi:hypothetical protein
MTQLEIDKAVAATTGESIQEIRRQGFIIADEGDIDCDLEPPRTVDWDLLDSQRLSLFP